MEVTAIWEWEGKSLRELNMRSKFGINVMAIKRGSDINVSPVAEDIIKPGDILVVIGGTQELQAIEKNKIK
jgi:trk system potassium uptake protein TrkA